MAADQRKRAETEEDEEKRQRQLNAARGLETLALLQESWARKAQQRR
jgi:hypothetical protein